MAKSFEATKSQLALITKPGKSIVTASNKALNLVTTQQTTAENLTELADTMEEAGVKVALVRKVRSSAAKLGKGLDAISTRLTEIAASAEDVVSSTAAIASDEAPAKPAKKAKPAKADKKAKPAKPAKKAKADKKAKPAKPAKKAKPAKPAKKAKPAKADKKAKPAKKVKADKKAKPAKKVKADKKSKSTKTKSDDFGFED